MVARNTQRSFQSLQYQLQFQGVWYLYLVVFVSLDRDRPHVMTVVRSLIITEIWLQILKPVHLCLTRKRNLILFVQSPPPSFKSIPISAEALGLAVKLNMPRTKQAAKGIDRIELTKISPIVYLFYRRIMELLGGASC